MKILKVTLGILFFTATISLLSCNKKSCKGPENKSKRDCHQTDNSPVTNTSSTGT